MARSVLVFVLAVGCTVCAQAASRDRSTMLAQASQGAPPEVCIEVYQPVCGTNPSGIRTTYSNACFARAGRATNVTPGECPKEAPRAGGLY